MSDKQQCEAQVHDNFGVSFHQCLRSGTLKHKGRYYCKQHFPPNVEKRREEADRKCKLERQINELRSDIVAINRVEKILATNQEGCSLEAIRTKKREELERLKEEV